MRITKSEAAVRQLDTAIHLFFENKDSVSVHTLAGAARLIFQERCLKEGKEPFICDIEKTFPEKTRSELLKELNKYQNWFKHGKILEESFLDDFKDEHNDVQLYFSVHDCFVLCKALPVSAQVFMLWFYKCYPDLADEKLGNYKIYEGDENLSKLSRKEQKEFGLEAVKKFSTNEDLKNDPKTFIVPPYI